MTGVFRKIGFLIAFILPALVVTGFYAGAAWNFITIVFAFILIPLVDQWMGTDLSNVPETHRSALTDDAYYRFVLYVWAYVQLAFVVWASYAITNMTGETLVAKAAFTLSVALVTGGIGITVAHELGHKKSTHERVHSKLLLMTVCYMHFYIEHNKGHHVAVATPEDPATARRNENFYAFWVRSVFLGYRHAWQLETERLIRNGMRPLSFNNQMLQFLFFPLLFCVAITAGLSLAAGSVAWEVPVFFVSQSVLAFTLLELVNYVEHYGMTRRKLGDGRYERVNPTHSWNASFLISNFFLFQLQRHSDHHAFAHKRYQVLHHYEESPQLPSGYPTMIMLALMPPAWFALMNPRLEAWEKQEPAAA
ncbi:MAG: alkane 1-monooxygenase [Bacteroidia bacterium]|nr:alkane 1-monooxygenase [Bacteroidia bacterium]